MLRGFVMLNCALPHWCRKRLRKCSTTAVLVISVNTVSGKVEISNHPYSLVEKQSETQKLVLLMHLPNLRTNVVISVSCDVKTPHSRIDDHAVRRGVYQPCAIRLSITRGLP